MTVHSAPLKSKSSDPIESSSSFQLREPDHHTMTLWVLAIWHDAPRAQIWFYSRTASSAFLNSGDVYAS